ncbi:hypothetical protein ScPMuIL_003924 [Solemya velum]
MADEENKSQNQDDPDFLKFGKIRDKLRRLVKEPDMNSKSFQEPEWKDPDSYNFNYSHRGLALIFTMKHFDEGHSKRYGAKVDLYHMEKTFQKLGFLVRKYHDLTTTKVIKVLEEAANRHDHSKSDCFVCAFSSHGQEKPRAETGMHKAIVQVMEHYIATRDSEIRTSDIISMFDEKNCPSLKNKPKLFFVQACRSRGSGLDSLDHGHHVKIYEETIHNMEKNMEEDELDSIPCAERVSDGCDLEFSLGFEYQFSPEDVKELKSKNINLGDEVDKVEKMEPEPELNRYTIYPVSCGKDMLIMFPAPSGYFGWSNAKYGGWLISALYKTVDECYPYQQDLLTLLTQVSNEVALWMQSNNIFKFEHHNKKSAPAITHMLSRNVIFSPK